MVLIMNKQILDRISRNKYIVYLDNIGIDIDAIKKEITKNISENEIEISWPPILSATPSR